jgi:RNA polymerase sigma-70 factor (ECF subfamily)
MRRSDCAGPQVTLLIACNLFDAARLYIQDMDPDLTSEAVERLYRDHGTRLWRGIYAFSGGRADVADDAVAEAFARALERKEQIREPLPWLYRVAFQQASTLLRKERRTQPEVSAEHGAFARVEGSDGSIGAFEVLPPSQRAAVFLHYYADMSVSDIARARGLTTVAVRVQLHRARQVLRRKYESTAAMSNGCRNQQGGDNYGRVA